MRKVKIDKKSANSEKKEIDKRMQVDFLKRFKHFKMLLNEIKDKDVKDEVKKDIEDIKEEIREGNFVKFDVKLVEESLARVENNLRTTQPKKTDDYSAERARIEQQRRSDSQLENAVQRLAEELPKKNENTAQMNYSGVSTKYGSNYMENYEAVKYGVKRMEEERIRRDSEFKIVEETMQYGQSEVSKDIYNKTKIKNKG